MDVVIDGRIKGAFNGWDRGSVFVLEKGFHKRWEQMEDRQQHHYLYRPSVKVLRDGRDFYLQVEGMDGLVEVRKA
jgi:hypothetical protein